MYDFAMRVAIYPGSFDPITFGHMDIVDRAVHLFDKVIISVAETDMKNPLFSSEERLDLVKARSIKIMNMSMSLLLKRS